MLLNSAPPRAMTETRVLPFKNPALTIAVLTAMLTLIFAFAGWESYFVTPRLEVGDLAVNALQIDRAKHFGELYGNYSRFEFNHPGPAFFYVYALGERVLRDGLGVVPSPENAHLLAGMALQCFFFVAALTTLANLQTTRLFLPLGLLLGAWHFGALSESFVSIWPPNVLLMPFLCLLAAAAAVASGVLGALPLLVLAGGFLFHGHVAQALFTVTTCGSALLLGLWQHGVLTNRARWRECFSEHRQAWLLAGGVAGLFALPLLIDLFTLGLRSNLATVAGRFYDNTNDHKSLWQALLYFLSFGTPERLQENIFTVVGPQVGEFFREHALRVGIWSLLLVGGSLSGWLLGSKLAAEQRRFLRSCGFYLGLTCVLCLFWGVAQAGAMTNFNGYFYYSIYFFALLLPLQAVAQMLERWASPRLALVLLALSAVAFTATAVWSKPAPVDEGATIAQGVADCLRAHSSNKPKLLIFEHTTWPKAAAVALVLQRQGIPFYVGPWWEFMFEKAHDLSALGDRPEEKLDVWWIDFAGNGGIPITKELSLFTSPAPIKPADDVIRFHDGENSFRYHVYGLRPRNIDFARSDMRRIAFLFQAEPAAHDVRVTFDAQGDREAETGHYAQAADVSFNGHLLGRVTVQERTQVTVTIPRAEWNAQPQGKLDLTFIDPVAKRSLKRPRYEWVHGWDLWSIHFESTPKP